MARYHIATYLVPHGNLIDCSGRYTRMAEAKAEASLRQEEEDRWTTDLQQRFDEQQATALTGSQRQAPRYHLVVERCACACTAH